MTVLSDIPGPYASTQRSFHVTPLRYRDVLGVTCLVGGATWAAVALAIRAVLA